MSRIFTLAIVLACLCCAAPAATHDVVYGTFEAPDDFVFKKTGTIDSFMGTLTRESDGFTIDFDIGGMAGTHMHPGKRDAAILFRTHKVNGNFAWTGIETKDGQKTITTTIYDAGERSQRREKIPKNPAAPANFWAVFKNETQLADFLLIVSTYQPKAPGPPAAAKP